MINRAYRFRVSTREHAARLQIDEMDKHAKLPIILAAIKRFKYAERPLASLRFRDPTPLDGNGKRRKLESDPGGAANIDVPAILNQPARSIDLVPQILKAALLDRLKQLVVFSGELIADRLVGLRATNYIEYFFASQGLSPSENRRQSVDA